MPGSTSFLVWVSLPPAARTIDLLVDAVGLAEPFVDFRYGTEEYRGRIARALREARLPGLTVCVSVSGLKELDALPDAPEMRVILSAPWEQDSLMEAISELRNRGIVVGVEVDSLWQAEQAAGAGADFVVATGCEAAGPVCAKTSFILLQELGSEATLPLVIRGGLGPRGAAAAWALGARGIILDSQLVLLEAAGLDPELRAELATRSVSDTQIAGDIVGRPFRFLPHGGKDAARRLAEREWRLCEEADDAEPAAFEKELHPYLQSGLSPANPLLPVGQGLAFAQQFAAEGLDLGGILDRYRAELARSIHAVKQAFPFREGSRLASEHRVRFPIVQGPMAVVTDTPRLAPAVLRNGGLPFCSTAGLRAEGIRALLHDARALIGDQPFGLGLVGFLPVDGANDADDAVLGDSSARPDFITIAGADAGHAVRLQRAGIGAYFHAPSQALIREYLDNRVSGIILEGHEAGGHVGVLGSLVLWELAVEEILARPASDVSGMRVLFAGGLGNARSSLAAAVLAAPLAERDIGVGLQLGTAYLMTDDAVECGAVSREYQQALLDGRETILTGKSVNLPNRWLDSPVARRMILEEIATGREKLDFRARKRKVEHLGTPRFRNALGRESGSERACACGQGIAASAGIRGISELHDELTASAEVLARNLPSPETGEEFPSGAIAIVGMGCVFPGAPNVETFWDNILCRRDFVREVPERLWDWRPYYSEDRSAPERTYTRIGAFVEGFQRDPLKFRIPPRSEPHIDTVQFYALECVYQALVDAGYLESGKPPAESSLPKGETAVFIGHGSASAFGQAHALRVQWVHCAEALRRAPEFASLAEEVRERIIAESEKAFKEGLPEFSEDTCAGVFSSLVAGRVANCFDLRGRAVVMDAACASAMAAVDAAVEALRHRECDVALAGGADQRVDATTFVFFCSLGALSAAGSHPFDERADGFVLGEGAGMLVLKRVEDAVRDGNRIYAVIRAIGASSDGRVKGITAPDVDGQIRALERTYRQVPFSPATVSLLEGHGTGTWTGDRAELTSISRFFSEHGAKPGAIALGSVKSMIGHLKTAAGVAGLIKMVMALHTKLLPPSIHCEQPRKDFDWAQSPCRLIGESRLWNAGAHPRRGAVNAFGFGGINFHVLLEEAPVTAPEISAAPQTIAAAREETHAAELILLRAPTRQALLSRLRELAARLPDAGDLRALALDAFSANSEAGPALSLVVRGKDELASHLQKSLDLLEDAGRDEITAAQGIYFRETPLPAGAKVAFLYPGQGVQYPGMLEGIREAFPWVEPVLQRVESTVRRHSRTSLLDLLCTRPADDDERMRQAVLLERTDYNHPTMLAVSTALHEILGRAGIRPDMVAGHSLGEYAALHAAGVYDVESSIRVVTRRGTGMVVDCINSGGMISVGLPAHEVEPYLSRVRGFAAVANKNCPAQTAVAGDETAVSELLEIFSSQNVRCVRLKVMCGFHSKLIEPAVPYFRHSLDEFPAHPPRMPVQCNVTGKAYTNGSAFRTNLLEMLVRHMTEPVDFIGNVESMYEAGARLFIEVGPGSTLSSFVDNILGERLHWTVATNLQRRDPVGQILHAVACCAALGLPVDLKRFQPVRQVRRPLRPAPRKELARASAAAPPTSPPSPALPAGRLQSLEAAFADKDDAAVAQYLAQRGEFLRQMMELDFAHFRAAKELTAPAAESRVAEAPPPALSTRVSQLVVDLVARATGYPHELIGLDLDVEAELGLDSIKQVEIVRQLGRELKLDPGSDTRGGNYRIGTLRELIARLDATPRTKDTVPAEPTASAMETSGAAKAETPPAGSHRLCSSLVALPAIHGGSFLIGKRVAILGAGAGLETPLARRLVTAGASLTDSIEEADCVLDLLSAESGTLPTRAECADWWKHVASAAGQLLEAAQRCVEGLRRDPAKKVRWVAISRLGGELGASGEAHPGVATGTGLAMARILAMENPGRANSLCLDFEVSCGDEHAASAIVQEMNQLQPPPEVGYRDGGRFGIVWTRTDLDHPAAPAFPLGRESVILAVGGARGITALIAQELARRTGARFIIVGQSAQPDASLAGRSTDFAAQRKALLEKAVLERRQVAPAELDRRAWNTVWAVERANNMERLRSLASQVEYRQCDLTDARQVAELVRHVAQGCGKLDVVIQGSGALPLKSIPDFTADEFVEGMAPRALATMNLIAALEGMEVGAFVNLSSVGSRWGNRGHAAYAAGHEIAAALVAAASRTRTGRWWNVHFGPWEKIGMTTRDAVMERLDAGGVAFIGADEGARFLADEIQHGPGISLAYYGGRARRADPSLAPFLDSLWFPEEGIALGHRTFDPKREDFVRDHRTDQQTAVLAGVLMMEMMAQAAHALLSQSAARTGGLELTEIADLEFPRAVRFPGGRARTVHVRARAAANGELRADAEVFSVFQTPGSAQRGEVLHSRGRLRFGRREAGPAAHVFLPCNGLGSGDTDATPIWQSELASLRRGMFRNIVDVQSVTRDGAMLRCQDHPIPALGRSILGHPILLDGATMAGLPVRAVGGDRELFYMSGAAAVMFYRAAEETDLWPVRCRMWNSGPVGDIEILDREGRVAVRIENYARSSASYRALDAGAADGIRKALREHPRQARLRELLELPPRSVHFAHADLRLLDAELGIDAPRLLDYFLSAEERREWNRLEHSKRKREWLGGRIAAKTAVRMLLDAEIPHIGMRIENGAERAPVVVLERDEDGPAPFIGISHSRDVAVALASTSAGLGIDVEALSSTANELLPQFATADEAESFGKEFDSQNAPTLLWAAKEACRKALGAGSVAATDLRLRDIRSVEGYGLAVFESPRGAVRCAAFLDNGYAWAVARREEAA